MSEMKFFHENDLKIVHIKQETIYECDICSEQCSEPNLLQRHFRMRHIKKLVKRKFKCEICSKEFNHKNDLSIHVNAVHICEKITNVILVIKLLLGKTL